MLIAKNFQGTRELTTFINDRGVPRADVECIFPRQDGTVLLLYWVNE